MNRIIPTLCLLIVTALMIAQVLLAHGQEATYPSLIGVAWGGACFGFVTGLLIATWLHHRAKRRAIIDALESTPDDRLHPLTNLDRSTTR